MGFGLAVRSLFTLPLLAFRPNAFFGRRKPEPRHRLALLLVSMFLPSVLAVSPLHAETAYFSGAVATLGGGFSYPYAVAVDKSGNIYVGDAGNFAVKEMPQSCASSSCVTTLGEGSFYFPTGLAVD